MKSNFTQYIRKRILYSIVLFLVNISILFAGINPVGLRCEYLENPQVVDVLIPRLSWVNVADGGDRGQVQTAWEIWVAGTRDALLQDNADLWNSGKVSSGQSYNIEYDGKPLTSRQNCWWQVRTWDKDGKASEWSEPAFWCMGLLDKNDWIAKWIGAPWQGEEPLPDPVRRRPGMEDTQNEVENQGPPPAPMLRKEFMLDEEISEARAFVTGLGYFEFYVNGKKASEDVLVPNQTDYGKRSGLENDRVPIENCFTDYRVMYLSYDITDMLKQGENAIGAILGNGFYNAPITWTASYGSPRFIGQVHVKYTDGTEDIIISDDSWKVAKGPIITDLVYDGEHYDARLEQDGWNKAGFDDSGWKQAVLRTPPEGKMKAHMAETDRVMERLEPVVINKIEEGHYMVDFGQEISGWLNISGVSGEAGHKIDIRYISNDSVSETTGSNSYTLKGEGSESYAARFTWFVFRYAELINWPGELSADQLRAEAVYTNVETTGKFETSNPLFNKINQIWWRSQTDNMHGGIASDCPNRERSPYTGDGQVACVTVIHNFDAKAFYNKWIQDIVDSQNPETGYVPNGAPWQPGCGGGPAWGAAINIMSWEYYLHYADIYLLSKAFEGMKGYVGYLMQWVDENGIMYSQKTGPDNDRPIRWLNLGDWSQPFELPPDSMVHTFYLWRCADFTAKAAKALGIDDEAAEYAAVAERTKKAFLNEFYDDEKGTYGPYGGNIFALVMGVPEDQKQRVIDALKEDIFDRDGHLDTGIFGTQFFFEVLADNGMQDMAYEAMNKKTQPSFGWWVENGNTTSWEGWSRPGSGNHPMFGGGLVWFYRKLAGMNTDINNPGYKNIIFKPQPVADMTYALYSNLTPYGKAGIKWEKKEKEFLVEVTVPVGSTAKVYVPARELDEVKENGKKIRRRTDNIRYLGTEDDYLIFSVNSGIYKFLAK